MSDYTVFPNAPITEAVIEIKAQLPEETALKSLESFHDHIKDRFPEKQEQRFIKADFKLSQKDTTLTLPTKTGTQGYLFRSLKEKKVVQSKIDGFAFNKLKPYENWDLFRSEGRELWKLYSEIVNPIKVTRIGLRYINRIEVPLPFKDFSEYLLTNPQIAPQLPQAVSHFFMRLEVSNPDIEATAIITQAMDKPTKTKRLPLILDIDVFRITEYVEKTEEMWEDFEKLRDFKNDIFFNSVTEKAKELFR
ncbi:MAG: TIGR04255 family protein [Desulfobacteraceae bacterium]|nr:TIGR04255 family protein [Desulfobacteraceae bacterium]